MKTFFDNEEIKWDFSELSTEVSSTPEVEKVCDDFGFEELKEVDPVACATNMSDLDTFTKVPLDETSDMSTLTSLVITGLDSVEPGAVKLVYEDPVSGETELLVLRVTVVEDNTDPSAAVFTLTAYEVTSVPFDDSNGVVSR